MLPRRLLSAVLLLLVPVLLAGAAPAPDPAAQVQVILRGRIPASGSAPVLRLDGASFPASPLLACFYERREGAPAWSDGRALRPEAAALLAALAAAADDGLRPEAYRTEALQRLAGALAKQADPAALAEADLLLSDAFLRFGADLRDGRINPNALYRDCSLERTPADLAAVLQTALDAHQVAPALADLAPPHPGYRRLREALGRYRRAAATAPELPPLPAGPTLKPGDRNERVPALRERLARAAEADAAAPVPPPESDPLRFDPPLAVAVSAFQERHGLDADGTVGKATLAEINESPARHISQLEVNLERWRWLPRDLGKRHILVNIAGFRLEAVESGKTALEMRVIVGKPYTRTPMFSSRLQNVVLNPSWYVPRSIAVKEILPRSQREPGYFAREGFERLPGGGLRQPPGPRNALGRIKLLFPNRFGVYLHDTPSHSLFSRSLRGFSHGCIRIEKPLELAAWVLHGDPRWTPAALQAALDTGREQSLPVRQEIAVHVAYWSAWVDDRGTLQVGRDLYDRDAPLAAALAKAGR